VTDAFLADGDDSGSRSIDDVSPSIGFVYDVSDRHIVYGNIATAFQTPTSTEFANPDGSGGFNADLEPQKSTGYELGLRSEMSANSQLEIAAFNIDVVDELIPFEIPSNPGRNYFTNAGKSQRRGVELALTAAPVPGLNLSLAYTWSRFEFVSFVDNNANDFSGNTIPGIPESFAFADIRYTHHSGLFGAIDATYADKLYANNANSATVDGATIANIRVGLKTALGQVDVEPFIGVNNLSNTAYTANTRINAFGGRFFEPGPERNVYGGVLFRYRYAD
jgi:iron complex outermembrane receptor protein